jgi:hypothetical protein
MTRAELTRVRHLRRLETRKCLMDQDPGVSRSRRQNLRGFTCCVHSTHRASSGLMPHISGIRCGVGWVGDLDG